jgi:hypothetical protein
MATKKSAKKLNKGKAIGKVKALSVGHPNNLR